MSRYIVQYSGGISSYWAARRAVEKHGVDNVTLLFADVLMEDEDLYRFLADTIADLKCRYVRIADGRDPWQVFKDARFIGNSGIDPCSKILKRQLLKRWIKTHCDLNTDVIVYGLDWTEGSRIEKLQTRAEWQCWFPLTEPPYLFKDDMLRMCRERGIEPPRLYYMGFAHNNCGGACVKAGQAQWALLYKAMPERYAYHERKEQEMREYLQADVSILKSKKKPLTLAALRERVQANDYDMFDWGGCGCAIDYGDDTA